MIDLGLLHTPAILRHYMLANTPRYLFKHLHAEPSVYGLATASTPEELMQEVRDRESKADRDPKDVAIAYAALAAMAFHDYRRVRDLLSTWEPASLTWGKHFASMLCEPMVATTISNVQAPSGNLIVLS